MKKIFTLLIFLLPLALYPQLPNTTYITASAGASIPLNKELNSFNTSFNAGVSYEFAISKMTVLGFDANFATFTSFKNEILIHPALMGIITAYDNGTYNTMGLMAFFKLQNAEVISLPVQPFVKIGVGASLIAQTGLSTELYSTVNPLPSNTSTGILFAPSLGMNIMIHKKNKIVFEAQYRMNKSGRQDVHAFLLNCGYSFRL